jgi:hypothetical protein
LTSSLYSLFLYRKQHVKLDVALNTFKPAFWILGAPFEREQAHYMVGSMSSIAATLALLGIDITTEDSEC